MAIMLERVVQQIRHLAGGPGIAQRSDRQLLEQFASSQDEDAFAELVRRHGPLVLGVCKRLLRHEQDAEDAFQATFVVLARKAGSVRWHDSVSHWLYDVACRVALKARTQSNLRQRHERQAGTMKSDATTEPGLSWQDARAVLDEELHRLPARFRAPLVLCYLEGKSRDEAARELGWSEGAVKGMLERGRALLRDRLARRGLCLSAGLLGALTGSSASAAVSAGLLSATVQAACAGTTGGLAGPVAALSEGVIRAMFLTKLKIAAAVLLTVGALASGVGVAAHQVLADRAEPEVAVNDAAAGEPLEPFADVLALLDQVAQPDDPKDKPKDAKPEVKPDLIGKVKEVSADGSRFVLVLPPKNKGDEPPTVEFKLVEGAKVSYFGVPEAGQKPMAGYLAMVWLVPGTKDAAQAIRLGLKELAAGDARPDLAGKVAAVAADQKSITVESFNKKDGQSVQHEIKLTDKTKISYINVADGGKAPTVGYHARVWLADGSKDTAAGVIFAGNLKKPAGEKPDPNVKPKPEKPDPNAQPKPEKPDPNVKPKPEKPGPNVQPKPEKPDPNAQPKPEKPGPNAQPKPEKPDPSVKPKPANPNVQPKPEKPDPASSPKPGKFDPNAQPRPEKMAHRELTLGVGVTKVLELSTREAIQEVINEKDTIVRVSAVAGDPTRVLVTGLAPGISRITLVGVNGQKETFGPK